MAAWLPEDFKKEMQNILGGEYGQYLESLESPPIQGLRVNRLKWDRKACMEKLPCRAEPVPWISNGLFYEGEARLSRDPYYFAGLYYLQEPSAMTPASLLLVEPGDMVLDICAAPGGKSTELGARLKGKGMLVANDISNSRAKALLKNLELSGISNMCVVSEPPERLSGAFGCFFDKILVDAPCSGEGMFRKDRNMAKEWEKKGPGYYSGIQRKIAGEAVKMLKPGGYLLYSTCTFSRLEDEGTVWWLLEEFPEMELAALPLFEGAVGGIGLEGCLRLYPHKIRGEGHFMALLRKKQAACCGQNPKGQRRDENGPRQGQKAEERAGISRERQEEGAREGRAQRGKSREIYRTEEFGKAGRDAKKGGKELDLELAGFLGETKIPWDFSRIVRKDDRVYYLPEGFLDGTGLRFLRTGLWMGTLKNGRFEPSQAMAMVLSPSLYSNCVSFDRQDFRVLRYLKGETVSLLEGEKPVKGWCLVCVDGFALGFGKGSGMTIKNKYYAGWRWQ